METDEMMKKPKIFLKDDFMKAKRRTVILSVVIFFIMANIAGSQAITEEARRHLARGEAAMEMAKTSDEYSPAIEEFRKAVRFAPRWPLVHFKLGLVYEKTGRLTQAIACFKEYLNLSPNASDASQIQDRIYKLEYRAERVLTAPEIIKTLISLSNTQAWSKAGNCGAHLLQFRDAHARGDDQVSVLTGFFLFGEGGIYKHKQVQGPLLEYSFIANTCPSGQHQRDYDCFGEALITLEVVSKKLVRVKQKSIKLDPNSYIPQGERSCVFQKNTEE